MEKENYSPGLQLDSESRLDAIQALDADIILGNPKYNCRYHGICEIQPSNTFGHYSEHSSLCLAKVRIRLNMDDELEIIFRKKTMSAETKRLHFSGKYFTISESIQIPLFASDFLKTAYTIRSGKYFITRGSGYYKLVFKKTVA